MKQPDMSIGWSTPTWLKNSEGHVVISHVVISRGSRPRTRATVGLRLKI